jgi:hypothetical protein
MRILFVGLLSACAHPQIADPVYFNHLFTVLDGDTAAAIEADALVKTLGAIEKRTTSSGDKTWTGFYLYGRETFLELFGPGDPSGPGASGIGLSVERIGALDRLKSRLQSQGAALSVDREDMVKDGVKIPWFRVAGLASWPDEGPLALWIGETVPSFMARRLSPRTVAAGDISRRTYLSTQFDGRQLLENFCGAHIRMPVVERERFAKAMRAYGWRVRREGEAVVAEDGSVQLVVVGDPLSRGLIELCLRLSRDGDGAEHHIGRSVLRLGPGRTGTWRF